jgi:hypothetical protein
MASRQARTTSYSYRRLALPCTGCTDRRSGGFFSSSPAARDSANSSGTNARYRSPELGRMSAFVSSFAQRSGPWILGGPGRAECSKAPLTPSARTTVLEQFGQRSRSPSLHEA